MIPANPGVARGTRALTRGCMLAFGGAWLALAAVLVFGIWLRWAL